MWNKVCLRFKLFKKFKAEPKNNPRMHSLQECNKIREADDSAAYFKVSTPVRSNYGSLKIENWYKIYF